LALAASLLLLLCTVSAQTVATSFPVPGYPQALAANTFTNHVYALSESADQVTDFDATSSLATYISLPAMPQSSLNGATAIDPFTNIVFHADGVNNQLLQWLGWEPSACRAA